MSGLLQDYPLRYCYYYCSYDDDDTAAYYERPYIYLFFFGTSRTLTEFTAYRKLRPMYNSFWILDSQADVFDQDQELIKTTTTTTTTIAVASNIYHRTPGTKVNTTPTRAAIYAN